VTIFRRPRKHQQEAITFHESSPMLGTMLWHGMGLGKTLSTLWIARNHLSKLRVGLTNPKFVVIVPKSAIPTWKRECFEQAPDLLQSMVIYPYSQLHNAIKSLKYIDVRLLILDESHYLKSPDTGRIKHLAEFLIEMSKVTGKFELGRIISLTGTPMPNGAHELFTSWAMCCAPNLREAVNRLLDPERYLKWKTTFSQKKEKKWSVGKGKAKRSKFGNTWEGVANEGMLGELLAPFVHYRRVEDCIDLPEKEEICIDLGLPDDKLLANANIEEPEAYMALLERLSRAKLPYLMDWVDDYLGTKQGQLVVFSNYRYPIEELAKKYPKDVRMITGSEKAHDRAINLKDFQEGNYRVLAMTYKCGSESLNLQNCSVSLYHGYPWTPGTVQQAMARTFRSGQNKRTLHYFLTSGMNDQRILGIIRRKEDAITSVENLLSVPNPHVNLKLDPLV